MKKTMLFIITSLWIASFGQNQKEKSIEYPFTKKVDTVDTYFDQKVKDPYRWLEDDTSKETAAWVKAQNKVADDYLSKIPYRDTIKSRLKKLWRFEKIGIPSTIGDFQYYYKDDGIKNYSILYRKDTAGKEEVFLNANTFSKEGTTSPAEMAFSKDGTKLAYAISEGGSDWKKIIVMDALNKRIIEDTIVNVKTRELAWKGNEGFFYSGYDKPQGSELSAKTGEHKLYFHKLGTKQKEDEVIFGADKKCFWVDGTVTQDGCYLIVDVARSPLKGERYVKKLSDENNPIDTITDRFTIGGRVVASEGKTLFIEINWKAPNKRLVSIDINNPQPQNWKEIIAETPNVMTVTSGGGYFFVKYLKDVVSIVKQFDYTGKLIREIELPGIGTAGGFSGRKNERTVYYSFTNDITPLSIFAFDVVTGKSEIYYKPNIDFDSDEYVSKQVFYTSKDGTKVPMTISYKKGLKLDGKNPTILYGYGGFNVIEPPEFNLSSAVWMQNGGVYARANLRGGGEYGRKWYDAGRKRNKQNTFDDFIAAGEFLIAEKYTSPDYLAIRGSSNGGLLVGATMTQRPDLMKVALPNVGVMDMLRYNKFTIGAGWAYDYGTAQDSRKMFKYLKGYSPLHNVKQGAKYPATLITTGDHDDRVVPAHSFKFAAELQEKQAGTNPVLIRVNKKEGHGGGQSFSAGIQETADVMAFTLYNMGVKELPKQ